MQCNIIISATKKSRGRERGKVGCGVRLSILILGRKRDSAILLLFVLGLYFFCFFTIPTPVCQNIDTQRVRDLLPRATRPCRLHTRRRTNTEVSYFSREQRWHRKAYLGHIAQHMHEVVVSVHRRLAGRTKVDDGIRLECSNEGTLVLFIWAYPCHDELFGTISYADRVKRGQC